MFQWLTLLFLICGWFVSAMAAPALTHPYPFQSVTPVIVIIMDDMGIHKSRSERALALPGNLTYAFLPYAQHGQALAIMAEALKKEVILHLPMEPVDRRRLDPGALTQQLDHAEFLSVLRKNLKQIPFIRGVNNHMGSLLTQQEEPMQWLMQELVQHDNLYFVDSRTSSASVGFKLAQRAGLPSLKRNIFLDNDVEIHMINRQFMQLIDIAREQGSAIAIAHPYPETLAYLESMLPALPLLGIRLISASDLIEHKNKMAAAVRRLIQTASLHKVNLPSNALLLPPNVAH